MIGGIINFYVYCVASIILFAGTFVAIPLTYNLNNLNDAHAQIVVEEIDDLSLELTYLS